METRGGTQPLMGESSLYYAIYTDRPGAETPKTDPEAYEFAGVMAMLNSSHGDMMSEPGWIMIMKPYQVSLLRPLLPTPFRICVRAHANASMCSAPTC
jgi:hypothetical protein